MGASWACKGRVWLVRPGRGPTLYVARALGPPGSHLSGCLHLHTAMVFAPAKANDSSENVALDFRTAVASRSVYDAKVLTMAACGTCIRGPLASAVEGRASSGATQALSAASLVARTAV